MRRQGSFIWVCVFCSIGWRAICSAQEPTAVSFGVGVSGSVGEVPGVVRVRCWRCHRPGRQGLYHRCKTRPAPRRICLMAFWMTSVSVMKKMSVLKGVCLGESVIGPGGIVAVSVDDRHWLSHHQVDCIQPCLVMRTQFSIHVVRSIAPKGQGIFEIKPRCFFCLAELFFASDNFRLCFLHFGHTRVQSGPFQLLGRQCGQQIFQ